MARKSYVLKDDGDEGSSSSSSTFDDSEDESVAAVTAAAAEVRILHFFRCHHNSGSLSKRNRCSLRVTHIP